MKKPEAVLEPTFIVLSLRPGRQQSRCWVIYTYTHMYTHCPHRQQRRRQPCLKGQLKCSFCQFHRRSHNQKSRTGVLCHMGSQLRIRERNEISHFSRPFTTPRKQAVSLAGLAESQGRVDRAPRLSAPTHSLKVSHQVPGRLPISPGTGPLPHPEQECHVHVP